METFIKFRKIVFLSLCCSFIGCAEKKDTMHLPLTSLNYSLDTVVIDPGSEILYLNTRLYPSRLSNDKKYLYNFDHKTFSMERVDLGELRLDSKIQFNKEGPDGVGDYLWDFRVVGADSMLLASYGKFGLFSGTGKKLTDLNISEVGKSQQQGSFDNVQYPLLLPGAQSVIMGIVSDGEKNAQVLAEWDMKTDTFRKIPLSLFEKSKQFQADFDDGTTSMLIGAGEYLEIENQHVIMGFSATSAIHILEPGADDFRLINYEEHLVPTEKTVVFPEKIQDRSLLVKLLTQATEEILHFPPFWDERNSVYYRLSQELVYDDDSEILPNQLLPDPTSAKIYLTVYDKHFKLLGETRIPELTKAISRHFAKDGKIWVFENVEDEMGFVRIAISDL